MTRPSSGTGPRRRELRLPGRLRRRTSGVAQAISRRSRALGRADSGGAAPEPTIADAERRADAALVAADDALLASSEELAALADPDLPTVPGPDAGLAPFRDALRAARADVDEACELRAKAATEPDVTAEADLLATVEALTRSAGARLDQQSRAFDAVRNLDRTISTVLPALSHKVALLRERIDDATRTRAELAEQYPQVSLGGFESDLHHVHERVDFAAESLDVAGQLLRIGDRRGAIARARAAEAAVCQATLLLDELAGVPDELSRARTAVDTLIDQLNADLGTARTSRAATAPAFRFAAATLEWARAGRTSTRSDPLATRRALMDSDAALVAVLGDVLDPDGARQRAVALADCCADSAAWSMRAASTAVSTRRAVVGAEARLRLAAARRAVAEADAADLVGRVLQLQRGDRLAEQALVLVHRDEAHAQDQVTAAGTSPELGAAMVGGILVRHLGLSASALARAATPPSLPAPRLGPIGAVSFGGLATRARRGGAGRF